MFRSGMKESLSNEIEIEDYEDEIIEGMLEFIYFHQVSSINENALDLLRIADQFQLPNLLNECEDVILKNLTLENAIEVYKFAHIYSPTKVKPIVMTLFQW